MTNAYDLIVLHYPQMTASERRVADHFLQHKPNIQSVSISPIATDCNVSPATLTRFARKLGYENFQAFRSSLSMDRRGSMPDEGNYFTEVQASDNIEVKSKKLLRIYTDALQATQDLISEEAISEAVTLLLNARAVYCFGQGNSGSTALDASTRFAPITNKFHWVADTHLQANIAALLQENDVILYFSFSAANRELIEIGQLVQNTPGTLILVTRFPNAPGVQFCDVLLQCGVKESPNNQGSVAAKIAQLFIVDLLFNEYSSRNIEEAVQNRKKTLNATSRKMITDAGKVPPDINKKHI